ncbi:cytidine deaminase [Pedobacter flavus]|uniref:Cytidine deaminase n=1 Tax=Pedobacter flavus TaxID=3113906 RepID=A0ABU7H1B4_9SPHI|nr:cytidine deaminase [Pedobacter sp. VNH31]MEE1885084.1 cytidine deaminase [Pedobacter sp. VNH31]
MEQKALTIEYKVFKNISELDPTIQNLCEASEKALATAYAPYSNFNVGTAIELEDGKIIKGSNQENVAYPSGLCAERVALFTIGSQFPNAIIKRMAITAQTKKFQISTPVTSCGSCLQVMAEFEQKQKSSIQVVFYCLGGEVVVVNSVKDLMPFSFVEDRLGD